MLVTEPLERYVVNRDVARQIMTNETNSSSGIELQGHRLQD